MTYRLTADHDELRAMVRELADERIAPRAAEIDATAEFPWDLKELLAKQDLIGIAFPASPGVFPLICTNMLASKRANCSEGRNVIAPSSSIR